MKLTTEQIDYVFTRHKHYEWYDLQSELVDHLANAIEPVAGKSKLSFDQTLNINSKFEFVFYGCGRKNAKLFE
jgi:hypothetical protein